MASSDYWASVCLRTWADFLRPSDRAEQRKVSGPSPRPWELFVLPFHQVQPSEGGEMGETHGETLNKNNNYNS